MDKVAALWSRWRAQGQLRTALLHALPISLLMLALFTYWFGRADRYIVFLYYHDMGPAVPDTSPFSRVTASRYWMAGLVAAGSVLVLYTAANWLIGRVRDHYTPPPWLLVWLLCFPFLLLGVLAITMTLNAPVLPWNHAGRVTLAALTGLARHAQPGRIRHGRGLAALFDAAARLEG